MFKRNLAIALGSAAATLIWMLIAGYFNLPPWPAFIGWCMFFLTGSDWNAVKVSAPCLVFGALMAWANVLTTAQFANGNPIWVAAIVTTIMAFLIAFAGALPLLQIVAVSFIGANIYFASGDILLSIILPIIGLFLGPLSNWFTNLFSNLLGTEV